MTIWDSDLSVRLVPRLTEVAAEHQAPIDHWVSCPSSGVMGAREDGAEEPDAENKCDAETAVEEEEEP